MVTSSQKPARVAVPSPEPTVLDNILYLTDFSPASDTALGYALAVARRYDSRLYVAHVIEPVVHTVAPEVVGSTEEMMRSAAEQQLARLLVSGRLRGVTHEVLLEEGMLWPTLSKFIPEKSIDLIVVGTHGRMGMKKFLLGSAAEEIYRRANCPVMTVGPLVQGEAPKETELKRILLATDFRPTSERAAAYALSLAQQHQARLTLLHVVEHARASAPDTLADLRRDCMNRLETMVSADAKPWLEPEFAVAFGNPADEIVGIAKSAGVDLVVLGLRRGTRLAGHLAATTAYKVVCRAPCPVLTVHG